MYFGVFYVTYSDFASIQIVKSENILFYLLQTLYIYVFISFPSGPKRRQYRWILRAPSIYGGVTNVGQNKFIL